MVHQEWSISDEEKCRLGAIIYQNIYNGIQLVVVRDHGQEALWEITEAFYREHQATHFLPGLKTLGIDKEPNDVLKAAKFHYYGNLAGGMEMEYVEETPEKVWIRFRPPYLWDSAIHPGIIGLAFAQKAGFGPYRGWYARDGLPVVGLNNPRLGFCLTHSLYRGDPWEGGYYYLADHDLDPTERITFSSEEGPLFDMNKLPKNPFDDWPQARMMKALRNYGVEFAGHMIRLAVDMYGPLGARPMVELTYKSVLCQYYREIAKGLQIVDDVGPHRPWGPFPSTDVHGIAILLQRLAGLSDEEVTVEEAGEDNYILRQMTRSRRFMPDIKRIPVQVDEAITEGWKALIWLLNPQATVIMTKAITAGDSHYEWIVRSK